MEFRVNMILCMNIETEKKLRKKKKINKKSYMSDLKEDLCRFKVQLIIRQKKRKEN